MEEDNEHNHNSTAWYRHIAILAEVIPVPTGDGVHGCLAMYGPSHCLGLGFGCFARLLDILASTGIGDALSAPIVRVAL